MKEALNNNKRDYVFSHLSQHYDFSHLLKRFRYISKDEKPGSSEKNIYFLQSEKELSYSEIKWTGKIPVLFPLTESKNIFFTDNGNLFFNDDLLKSSFYFLSGYQEYLSNEKDDLGRFPYDSSIQKKLDITETPVVNHYFSWIIEGLTEFCEINNLSPPKKINHLKFSFFLSHDIDRLRFYSMNNLLQRVKDILGLTQTRQSNYASFKQFWDILLNVSGIINKKDPWWNFEYLLQEEEKRVIKATYYFLHKDIRHRDSYYSFAEPAIKELITKILKNHETGIHGTINSADDPDKMLWQKKELENIINDKVEGVRQHNLIYKNPQTAIIHEKSGYLYDSTLGFAEHEGFRNSYCLPFKLYNFQDDTAFTCWEIPLNIMDVTLFHYRDLDLDPASEQIIKLAEEIKKFDGVLSLLWHNNHFNESLIPGITEFYENILDKIMNLNPEAINGKEIINRITLNN